MSQAQTPPIDYDYSIPFDVYFALPEVFNSIMPALIHQLSNTNYLADNNYSYA